MNAGRAELVARHQARTAAADALARQDGRVSSLRLLVATAGAGYLGLSLWRHAPPWLWVAVPGLAFVVLVVVHERVIQRLARARRAAAHYARALARVDDAWAGSGDVSDAFAPPDHPYAKDLDLFGPGSLFELLGTCRTARGQAALAGFLLRPASLAAARARQGAVKELAPRLDLREDVALLGDDGRPGRTGVDVVEWSARKDDLPEWARALVPLSVAATLVSLLLWALGVVPFVVVVPVLSVQGALAAALRRDVAAVLQGIDAALAELSLQAALLARLEREAFTDPHLRALHQGLLVDGQPPSVWVARLARLALRLHQQKNQFFVPIAAVLAWRFFVAVAVVRWRRRAGPALGAWLAGAAELDALMALAAYAHEHEADAWPALVDDGPRVEGRDLGHPLLPGGGVRNDVALGGGVRLLLVSGSNMSGKSTYLRVVGVNVLLASCGAPVRAAALTVSSLSLGATLRVQDSLRGGASRFYAEVQRLQQLMTLAAGDRPLLFLVDELLHGTNSHDRQLGGAAVLRGLVDKGAIGLATTHDLALTAVVDALPGRARNVHFADDVVGERLVFDHKLKDGVVQQSNALRLMRAVGLDV